MSHSPPDGRALRWLVYAAFVAFFIGFFTVLAALEWFLLWSIEPDTAWWEILHFAVNAILIAVVGGLACCAGTVLLLDKWDRRRAHCPEQMKSGRYCR